MTSDTLNRDQPSLLDGIDENFRNDFLRGPVKEAMKAVGGSSGDLWKVPIDAIGVMDGFNVRVKDESYHRHIRWIADSIKSSGFHVDEPLGAFTVKEGNETKIYVHAGHCRLEAAKLARAEGAAIETLPVVVVPREANLEDLTVALITTNGGKPLTPYETSIVVKRLAGFHWEPARIAEKLGFSSGYVEALLQVSGYPLAIREMIQSGQLALSTAIEAVRLYGGKAPQKLEQAAQKAASTGKTRVTTQHLPGHKFTSFVKRSAPKLYAATQAVKNDPGYHSLAPETRQMLDDLITHLSEKEKALDGPSQATESDGLDT